MLRSNDVESNTRVIMNASSQIITNNGAGGLAQAGTQGGNGGKGGVGKLRSWSDHYHRDATTFAGGPGGGGGGGGAGAGGRAGLSFPFLFSCAANGVTEKDFHDEHVGYTVLKSCGFLVYDDEHPDNMEAIFQAQNEYVEQKCAATSYKDSNYKDNVSDKQNYSSQDAQQTNANFNGSDNLDLVNQNSAIGYASDGRCKHWPHVKLYVRGRYGVSPSTETVSSEQSGCYVNNKLSGDRIRFKTFINN